MAKYKILSWHGIPSQVRATDVNGRVNKQLPPRFQEAIDEAAMSLGKIGTDAYTDGFQWSEAIEQPGTAEEVAGAVVSALENEHPSVDWRSLVEKGDME